MAPLITEDNFGAWLVKCDPVHAFDLAAFLDSGRHTLESWSVRAGYRADLIAPGDRVVFWVSGTGRIFERGIWGTGYTTDVVQDSSPEAGNPTDVDYWRDPQARRSVGLFVPCHIPLFEDVALTAAELRAHGLGDLEVLRMPQGSNPSWVSAEQLDRLGDLLPWPEDDGGGRRAITVSAGEAGLGDPHRSAIVEAAAMAAVIDHYGRDWTYDDVRGRGLGWDIVLARETERHGEREVRKVEVKGVGGLRPNVLLTPAQVRAAAEEDGWSLAVVLRALSDPRVVEYTGREVVDAAAPYVYRVELAER